jgi:hypothetical protein
MREMRNSCIILVVKPERKRQLRRPRRRLEDNIILDHRKVRWEVCTGFVWLRIGTSGGLL